MPESYNDHDDAFTELGGLSHEPSVESARAMLAAGLGGTRERAIVEAADGVQDVPTPSEDPDRAEYIARHLSGKAERTPEQEAGLRDFKALNHDLMRAAAIAGGMSPQEFDARERARNNRR